MLPAALLLALLIGGLRGPAGAAGAAAPIQIAVPFGKTVMVAVNAGGVEYESDVDGVTYEMDSYFVEEGSKPAIFTTPVAGNDTLLYQSERRGERIRYVLPLERKGVYTLVLKLADHDLQTPSDSFDVLLNGLLALPAVDIAGAVGFHTALDLSVVFSFTGGSIKLGKVQAPAKDLVIDLVAVTGNAKVNGLVLVKGVLSKSYTLHAETAQDEWAQEGRDALAQQGVPLILGLAAALMLPVLVQALRWLYRSCVARSRRQKLANAVKKNLRT